MGPGRELDALIAEKVMGLELWPEQHFNERAFKAHRMLPGQEAKPCACPCYSSDIAAAWTVVEKQHSLGRSVRIYYSATEPPQSRFEVRISDGNKVEYAEGETGPGAICKAALIFAGI